jgi:predicted PurR-regulated permease PerM
MATVQRWGLMSWASLGIIALVVVLASAVSALSGILIPLVIAVILGAVLEPVVRGLRRLRAPASMAAVGGLVLAIVVMGGVAAVVVAGFIRELPEISAQLGRGWTSLSLWVRSLDLETAWLMQVRTALDNAIDELGSGVLGLVVDTVYGAVSLVVGCFFALIFLFFVLRDGERFPLWLARLMGQDPGLFVTIDSATRSSLRGYFRGTAVTALITAPIFIVPLLILRVPLVVPIMILYFVLSFVPYVGAWVTGGFAVLIAFGSGGAGAAAVVAVSLIVSNGTLQNVGSALRMHPLAVMLATLIGGVVAGLLGMILGPPLLSAIRKAMRVIGDARSPDATHTSTS